MFYIFSPFSATIQLKRIFQLNSATMYFYVPFQIFETLKKRLYSAKYFYEFPFLYCSNFPNFVLLQNQKKENGDQGGRIAEETGGGRKKGQEG